MCVCVREREREREWVGGWVGVFVCMFREWSMVMVVEAVIIILPPIKQIAD